MRTCRRSNGSALLVVLVFVSVFGALVVGYLSVANASLQGARLCNESRRAQAAAESGLALAGKVLPRLVLPDSRAGTAETLAAIAAGLNDESVRTLFGGSVACVEGSAVRLAAVTLALPEGLASFQLTIEASPGGRFVARSLGASASARRSVAVEFATEEDRSIMSTFGVASRSAIRMMGNANIVGANNPKEGSVLSTTMVTLEPVEVTGHVGISGDVAISNPDGSVSTKGNTNIEGDILIGVDEPPFPEIDTSVFEPYAVNIVDSSTPTSSDCYLENIRIAAGTNPTFTGHCTINGVVYIESPNNVHFTGGASITGMIVVEVPEDTTQFDSNRITFNGNVNVSSPSMLPDAPQFDGLRDMTGSFLLAPGYETVFNGTSGAINGSIVASKMAFSGNAETTISGSVLNIHDTAFEMSGDARVIVDHSNVSENLAGMVFPRRLVYREGSYTE